MLLADVMMDMLDGIGPPYEPAGGGARLSCFGLSRAGRGVAMARDDVIDELLARHGMRKASVERTRPAGPGEVTTT